MTRASEVKLEKARAALKTARAALAVVEKQERMLRAVEDLFASLGTDPAEIAARLADAGCYGWPRHEQFCPVALLLRKYGLPFRLVGNYAVYQPSGPRRDDNPDRQVTVPMRLRVFLHNFDTGSYPFLLAIGAQREDDWN